MLYYHIYQRFNDKGVIFYDYPEYLLFLTILSTRANRYRIKIIALCQMINHIHLLACADSLSEISRFVNDYSSAFNREYSKRHNIKGPLFQSPFGRALKRSGKSIRSCIAYVYNNPVEKRLCKEAIEYRWNYLAYAASGYPFSDKIKLRFASRPLRRAVKEADSCFASGRCMTYNQLIRLTESLSIQEKEQFCDRIIGMYCPTDFKIMSGFFCGFKEAVLVVAVTNSPKHDFSRCKSVIYKFLSRDTKSARDKNGTKPRKNKVKNTLPEISLVEYLCFVCKGTNLSLEKRGEIPISLIHNSFSYHCTPNVVIANGFDLKRLGLRKLGVKFCFALCWTFSKTRTGNRTKDLPPLLSNPWFCECLNDRHLKMLNFK